MPKPWYTDGLERQGIRPWTSQDAKRLRKLWEQGLTNAQIAAEMGRSASSISRFKTQQGLR